MQSSIDLLEKYKRQPFASGLIPYQGAVRVVDERFARIFVKDAGRQRWVVCDKNTKEAAVFSHAAVISSADDIETGNYVPDGKEVPFGVEENTVQKRVNGKCNYTYKFDTYTDISLYEGQWALDAHMGTVPGFNPGTLPRRAYLSGREEKYRSRFWMQTPMFLRRDPKEVRGPPPTHLHPWVVRGDQTSKIFRANPDRPRVWVKGEDGIVPISERDTPYLQRGDVVAMSFTVTYHITSVNWFAQFHPVDIVVLKSHDANATDYGAPALDLHNRPPPLFDAGLVDEVSGDQRNYDKPGDRGDDIPSPSNVMEGIDNDDSTSTASTQVSGEHLEAMEVDDGGHVESGEEATRSSTTGPDDGDKDGFTMVVREDEQDQLGDDDVDVNTEEGKRAKRAGNSRGTRVGRKRLHAAIA